MENIKLEQEFKFITSITATQEKQNPKILKSQVQIDLCKWVKLEMFCF